MKSLLNREYEKKPTQQENPKIIKISETVLKYLQEHQFEV